MGATPYLDDSPMWWKVFILPPLVVILVVAITVLTAWDWTVKRWCR